MHSNVSVLHTDDYENSVRLITEIVRSLNDETYQQIVCGKLLGVNTFDILIRCQTCFLKSSSFYIVPKTNHLLKD